jgi:hypothetical protein
MVSSSGITYANMVSVPAEKHNRFIFSYITTYPLSCTRAFSVARTMMHTLQERIHVLCKWPQDIHMSPRPRCAVMVSRTTYTHPLPHDRDCPQANLVLRGWVQDSYHPTGGYLPSYLVIGASSQNSKLHKVSAESKSQLAYHMLRLL